MRNIIVLGCGRSGTSMVTGSIVGSSYQIGKTPLPPNQGNPKGFFESFEVRGLNEDILAPLDPLHPDRDIPQRWQRWLAPVPVGASIPTSKELEARIQLLTNQEPYCYKDPRFCLTLPTWRPFLKNVVFICVFRDPATTAASILKFTKTSEWLRSLDIDFDGALAAWRCLNEHILTTHRHIGEWIFLHYDQILNGNGLHRISKLIGAPVDLSFPDRDLKRTKTTIKVDEVTQEIYLQLCRLANFDAGQSR